MPTKGVRRVKRRVNKRKAKNQDVEMKQVDYIRNAGLNIFGRVMNTPLPTKLKAKLRYFDFPTMNIGLGGAAATQVYNANGMYDPDYSGAGGQPRGFDQLMSLYDHFVVIGSKITVQVATGAGIGPVMCVLDLKDTNAADANIVASMESSYATNKLHSPAGNTSVLVQTFSPKFLGRSHPLSDPDLKGSDSANPAEAAYYHLVMASIAGVDETAVYPSVVIEYTCIFIEPKRPSAS